MSVSVETTLEEDLAVLTFRLTQFKLFQARVSKKQNMMRFGLAVLFGGDCLRFRVFCNEACNHMEYV